jgi:ABC-type polar amino acid transport system ATPase subunit
MLKINNVSKIVHQKKILDHICLNAVAEKTTFLLGESGAGKSTLLRILNNLETYDSGEITLDDISLHSAHKNKQISLVFQHFNLFLHLTVKRNITLVLEKICNKSAQEADFIAQSLLKKYKLDDKASASISELSGGQKQRLAIARSLATNPQVICFDEPTSALDPLLTTHISQEIQQLTNEKRIVIVATHDMKLILSDNTDGIVHLMKDGRIIEVASIREIKENTDQLEYLGSFIKG